MPATARAAPRTHIFTTADRGLSGTTATPLNAWTHLAATYDGATSASTSTASRPRRARSTGAIRVSTGALRIGGNNIWSNEWFAGLIDELRVYNRALSAAEISADMTRPVTGG